MIKKRIEPQLFSTETKQCKSCSKEINFDSFLCPFCGFYNEFFLLKSAEGKKRVNIKIRIIFLQLKTFFYSFKHFKF